MDGRHQFTIERELTLNVASTDPGQIVAVP